MRTNRASGISRPMRLVFILICLTVGLSLLGAHKARAATSPLCKQHPESIECQYCTQNPTAPNCSYCASNPNDASCQHCASDPDDPNCQYCAQHPDEVSCKGTTTPTPTPTEQPSPTPDSTPTSGGGDGCIGTPDFDTDGTTPLDDDDHVENLCNYVQADWVPNFLAMAEQLSTVMMGQIAAIGMLIDAEIMQDTERQLQVLDAEAHRDYQPDLMMCVIGGNVRSLAASEQKARVNTRAIDLSMLKRDMLSQDMSGALGPETDFPSRFQRFQTTYCDVNEANGGLASICDASVPAARINKDIDYTDTIESHYTLDADFTDTTETADEDDIIALSRNLFAFRNFRIIPDTLVQQSYAKDQYQDQRSVEALRSIATNSFSHIVGMRTAGSDNSSVVKPYMDVVLNQLGITGTSNADIDLFLGKNPSYYAQMEVLTHKLYEDPRFFTNLYATPANVERIGATLQALRLMQDRDRFEGSLRREMLASALLELSVRDRQEQVQNKTISCTYAIPGC